MPNTTEPPRSQMYGGFSTPAYRGRDGQAASEAAAVGSRGGIWRVLGWLLLALVVGASVGLIVTWVARQRASDQQPAPAFGVVTPAAAPTPAQTTARPAQAEALDAPMPPPLPIAPPRVTAAPTRLARSELRGPLESTARTHPATRTGPAFHCSYGRRPSEELVCGDAELSALDRQLNHAFYLAVKAGARRGPLRARQDRWELEREAAARHGRGAVAALYRTRIAQLNALAQAR
jgi:uncharacterized protein YecT (DUF1311 family)